MENFKEILADLILETGLSLRKTEKECGVASSQISRYLKRTVPKIEVAIKLANYFNVSLDYLFGISDERNHKNYINKNYDLSGFLERYEKLLKHNKTTHWKFAKQYGFSESCRRHWKSGGDKPNMETLVKIAFNLSGSIDGLLGRI